VTGSQTRDAAWPSRITQFFIFMQQDIHVRVFLQECSQPRGILLPTELVRLLRQFQRHLVYLVTCSHDTSTQEDLLCVYSRHKEEEGRIRISCAPHSSNCSQTRSSCRRSLFMQRETGRGWCAQLGPMSEAPKRTYTLSLRYYYVSIHLFY
jgi:hypothetical protein